MDQREPTTVASILGYMQRAIEEHLPLAPTVWIDAASRLNVLLGNVHDELCEREQEVATLKLGYLAEDEKRNVSAAKARVQITDAYKEMRKLEFQVKRVEEFIRLGKLKGRLLDSERRSN